MSRRSDAGRGALEDLQEARRASVRTFASPVEELEVILERVRRLRMEHSNPERFHLERSDIAGALGGLIKRMRDGASTASVPVAPTRIAVMQSGRSPERRAPREPTRPILHLRGPV